jgi:hypothetical protein
MRINFLHNANFEILGRDREQLSLFEVGLGGS